MKKWLGVALLCLVFCNEAQAAFAYGRRTWTCQGPGGDYGFQEIEIVLGGTAGVVAGDPPYKRSLWETVIYLGPAKVTLPFGATVSLMIALGVIAGVVGAVICCYDALANDGSLLRALRRVIARQK